MSDFSTEEKSKFLKGVVEKIVVHTVDKQEHSLKINFRLPYVGDTLVRNTSKTTSSKFKVKKGKIGLNVQLETSKK